MKRIAVMFLTLGLLATACGDTATTALPGGVGEARAVSLAGERLFVTTPLDDALRVVQLPTATTSAEFIRAPNPLFALQIPAVRRPGETLTLDPEGDRPVVVVASTLDPQLRLIDPESLEPLGAPVPVPGRPVQMTLMPDGRGLAVAFESVDAGTLPGTVEVLSFDPAVFDPAAGLAPDAAVVAERVTLPVDALPGGLAVTDAAGPLEAWVSDLRAPEVVRLDLSTGAETRLSASRILGRLVASPAVEVVEPPLPAGTYVYGLAAGTAEAIAFDVPAGGISSELIFEGKVLPIPMPAPGIDAVAIPAALVRGRQEGRSGIGVNVNLQVPVLLLVAMVDGDVFYAHGVEMQPIDRDADMNVEPAVSVTPPVVVRGSDGEWTDEPDTGAPLLRLERLAIPPRDEPAYRARVEVTPGVTRSRTWTVGWQADVPGQTDVLGRLAPADAGLRLEPLFPPEDLAERVAVGDTVRIPDPPLPEVPEGATDNPCAAWQATEEAPLRYEVTAVDGTGLVLGALADGPALPATTCFPEPFGYTVVAGGFTVSATGLDPVWRIEPGDSFVYEGERFIKTDLVVLGPALRFTLLPEQPTETWEPGVTRVLEVDGGADPILMAVQGAELVDPLDPSRRRTIGNGYLPGYMDFSKGESGFGSAQVYLPYGHCDTCGAPPGMVISFDARVPTQQTVYR